MEGYQQNQCAATQTERRNGKTLVTARPFTDPSQTYRARDWLDDPNEDRRQSSQSLNKKRPSQQPTTTKGTRPKPRPKRRTSSSSPDPEPTRPTANDLYAKWTSQPALEDSDSGSDDMRLNLYLSQDAKRRLAEERKQEYIFVSQDGTQLSSSAPRADLQVEVSIGRGDGESLASSAPSSAGVQGFAPSIVGSVRAAKQFLRDGSIGYSSDEGGGGRDDSFLKGWKRGAVAPSAQKPRRKVVAVDSGSETEFAGKKVAKVGKGKGKIGVNGVTNLTKLATSKRDGKKKEPLPPSPVKRPAPSKKTQTKSKRRVVLDTSSEESSDDISILPRKKAAAAPIKGKGKAVVGNAREKTLPITNGKSARRARERTPPPAKPKKSNKRKRLTLDDEGPIISPASSDSDRAPRRKLSKRVDVRTPVKSTKGKRPPHKVAIPVGFPSPMRAPVRVNEALLRPEEPVVVEARQKYRINALGEEEEIIYGPNGAEPLPLGDMVYSDAPTLQLPPSKIPGLIARKISEDKCPYCDNHLPIAMSPNTDALYEKLRATRPTSNGDDWTRTIEFCERHSAESHVFPLGLHSGYPGEINFTELRARVKKLKPAVKRMLKRPKDSPFYLFASRDFERQGRRRWAGVEARNDEQRKNRLLPGYFGSLGKMVISSVLRGMLRNNRFARLVTEKATEPFDVEEFIEHVLVLEVAVHLIQEDMVQRKEDGEEYDEAEKRTRALQILKESREYGRLRFGIGSEYLAEEDAGNGATQMVIADVRGLHDVTDDDSDGESSSDAEQDDEARDLAQSDSGNTSPFEPSSRQPRMSSPQRISDDDQDDIRPAGTPEVLALASSPVQSIATHRSDSPEAIIVDPPTPSRNTVSQIDKSLAPVSLIDDDVDDDFDDPGESLDSQALIDAANGVEESHVQQQKRNDNIQTTKRKRAPPKFADGTLAISRDRPQSTTGSTGTRDSGISRVHIVHDVDGDDDPLSQNLGQHSNLIQRTQTRQTTNTNGLGGPSRGGGHQSRGPNRRLNEPQSNASPYHFSSTAQGPPRIGMTRGSARAGPSGSGGQNGGGRPAEPKGMFIPKKGPNQALRNHKEVRGVLGQRDARGR